MQGCKKIYKKDQLLIFLVLLESGSKNNSVYSATKFAVNGMTQSLAKEFGSKNLRVNAVCPVLIKTSGLVKALKKKTLQDTEMYNHF